MISRADLEREYDPALNRSRQALYRLAAAALADPRGAAWHLLYDGQAQQIARDAAAILRDDASFVAAELAPGELPLARLDPTRLIANLPASSADLNQLYERVFGLLTTGACTPYETEYVPSKFIFQRSNGLADVSGFYRAFGLAPSTREPERPDHIVVELEFMANLIALEREATEDKALACDERALVCRAAQTRFLREHLAWWTPAFARLLARSADGTWYVDVAEFLAALIAAERAYLNVSATRLRPEPTTIERPEECSGCELAGAGI